MDEPVIPDDTSFKGCWEQLARDRRLPADPDALLPPTTVAQARRIGMEIFSWGLRHQESTRRRLDQLFPKIDAEALTAGIVSVQQAMREERVVVVRAAGPAPTPDPSARIEQLPETIYHPPGRLF